MMQIRMVRGDIFCFPFRIYIDGEKTDEAMDDIFFTVKKHHYDRAVVFQKKLSAGTIHTDGNGNYMLRIDPEDTDQLDLGSYDFDVEIEKLPWIKRTFNGVLELTREVTFREDEGAGRG